MWNHLEYTDRLIKDLNDQTHPNFDLLLVDDGSSPPYNLDTSPDFIKGEKFLLRIPQNEGLMRAWNTGTAAAMQLGYDLVLYPNNDLTLSHNLVATFCDYLDKGFDVITITAPEDPREFPEGVDWKYGFGATCFCMERKLLERRKETLGYYFDPAFRGADLEDYDLMMWIINNKDVKSIRSNSCKAYGNCSATSMHAAKPNKDHFNRKWGNPVHSEIERLIDTDPELR
jgi:glycosyltransferase involved in cell wall biosynthesis